MPDIYNYDPATGELISVRPARLDPRDLQPLVPAHATLTEPPAAQDNEVAIFDGTDWAVQSDFRGTYWLPDGNQLVITAIGEAPPIGAVEVPPEPSLQDLKAQAILRVEEDIDSTVMAAAGNPSRREISSWAAKAVAAQSVIDGVAPSASVLVPVQVKHGVTATVAAQRVLDNARMHELVNTAAETIRETTRQAINAATDAAEIAAAEAQYVTKREARLVEMAAIRAALEAGNTAPYDAALAEIQSFSIE